MHICSKCVTLEHKHHKVTYLGQSVEYLLRSKKLQIEFMRKDLEKVNEANYRLKAKNLKLKEALLVAVETAEVLKS